MSEDPEAAYPVLEPDQIRSLAPYGRVRTTHTHEVLWSEGERGFAFFVVLEGRVAILEASHGEPREVAAHGPGEFTGDPDVLTGRASLVTAVATEPGRVLELDAEALQRVVRELPEVSEIVLQAFLTRRSLLLGGGYAGIRIIGSRYSPEAHRLRDFAARNAIPFTWLDLEKDRHADALLRHFGVSPDETPIVVGIDGGWTRNPDISDLARHAGLSVEPEVDEVYDLVVVGAGPAGLGSAVYTASEGLKTLVVEPEAPGGQAGASSLIENYLGFPAGVSGMELANNALLQAQKFGAVIAVPERAVALHTENGRRVVVLESGLELTTRCVLIATGVEYRDLTVPGMRELEGAGIYHIASDMEARLCQGDEVAIVGGGNSAGQAAVFLSRSAGRVHLILRGDDLGSGMSRYLVNRVEGAPNILVHRQRELYALEGEDRLARVRLRSCGSDGDDEIVLPVQALFMFIGGEPRTGWLRDVLSLDAEGFVLTGPDLPARIRDGAAWRSVGRAPSFLETSVPGVFAAGDVRSGSIKRVASAVGEGAMVASLVHAHIGRFA